MHLSPYQYFLSTFKVVLQRDEGWKHSIFLLQEDICTLKSPYNSVMYENCAYSIIYVDTIGTLVVNYSTVHVLYCIPNRFITAFLHLVCTETVSVRVIAQCATLVS